MTLIEAKDAYVAALAEEAAAALSGDAAWQLAAMVRVDAAEDAMQDAKAGSTSLERIANLLAALG